MAHAERFAEMLRAEGLRTARAWGRPGVGARVYLGDYHVSVGQDGTLGTASEVATMLASLWPEWRQRWRRAVTSYIAALDRELADRDAQAASDEDRHRAAMLVEGALPRAMAQARRLRTALESHGVRCQLDVDEHTEGWPTVGLRLAGQVAVLYVLPDGELLGEVPARAAVARGVAEYRAGASSKRENPSFTHRYLPLSTVRRWEAVARDMGVSEVARSPSGFLTAYKRAGGNPSRLDEYWRRRREGFIARHMAQAEDNAENLWIDGLPSRRHLALIMWAYSPAPARLA